MRKISTQPFDFARAWYFAALILTAIVLPWWVAFALVLYMLFRYPAYEVFVAGILIDTLYGGGAEFWGTPFFATILFTTVAVIAPFAKRGIIFYP
jgi:hypothetical protein